MTESKTFKRRVRARMTKTGESYTSARAQLSSKRERVESARGRLAPGGPDHVSEDKLIEATGKGWDHWFSRLDAWGGRTKSHTDIARHLLDDLGVPG